MVAPPKDMSTFLPEEPVNMIVFGKGVFADVINNLEMRSFWIIRVDPNSNDSVLTRERREGHVKREAEIRIM